VRKKSRYPIPAYRPFSNPTSSLRTLITMNPDEQTISEILSLEDNEIKVRMLKAYIFGEQMKLLRYLREELFIKHNPEEVYTLFLNQQ
jgi:hypothetical protein